MKEGIPAQKERYSVSVCRFCGRFLFLLFFFLLFFFLLFFFGFLYFLYVFRRDRFNGCFQRPVL